MGAPQYEQAGADIGGTGTTNTIPRWTGASTLGDSIIIQGSTANAIGIGNAPTTDLAGYKALEVGGLGSGFVNADNDLWITANAKHSGGGWKYAVTASTPSNSIRANAGAIIFNRAGNGTAGNALTWLESARIDSSGNVGIGTASPVKKGTIKGGDLGIDYGQALCFTNGGTAVYTADAAVRVTYSSPNDVLQLQASGSSDGIITFHTGAAAALRTERARIDSSGRFLVGTSTAGIGGNSATAFTLTNGTATVYQSIRASGTEELYLYAAAGSVGLYSYTNTPVLFGANNAERMRLTATGNIYGTSGTTGMTDGFFYIPAAAGTPTGTPTAVSGRVPMYYDTTNNKFYIYNGAWKAVTLA